MKTINELTAERKAIEAKNKQLRKDRLDYLVKAEEHDRIAANWRKMAVKAGADLANGNAAYQKLGEELFQLTGTKPIDL